MRNVTKDNITDVFMGSLADDMDPRLREVVGSSSTNKMRIMGSPR